jgi:hypothetical protein
LEVGILLNRKGVTAHVKKGEWGESDNLSLSAYHLNLPSPHTRVIE